jgi:hypothetical protein
MNDQDQPLGAPNFHSNTQSADSNQPPKKPKRKLNWKGFGIGVIAVIVIEFFAISMLQMGEPQINPPETPVPTAKPTVQADSAESILVSVTKRGGLCQQGQDCSSTIIVTEDGTIQDNENKTKKLTEDQTNELKKLITSSDFAAIKKTPFTGTCPIAFDGQEIVYVFSTKSGIKEEIPSCTYQVDENAPIFKFMSTNVLN